MKQALSTAIRDYHLLQTDTDKKRLLVEKCYLFARDKYGC